MVGLFDALRLGLLALSIVVAVDAVGAACQWLFSVLCIVIQ